LAGQEVLVIVEVQEVRDGKEMAAYQAAAREQMLRRGGVVVARGGVCFEGDPSFEAMLIQRWPSEEAFREWQNSDEYRPLFACRKRAADLRIAIVPST
jgi:uncharacterized protein (DUF1330 family)